MEKLWLCPYLAILRAQKNYTDDRFLSSQLSNCLTASVSVLSGWRHQILRPCFRYPAFFVLLTQPVNLLQKTCLRLCDSVHLDTFSRVFVRWQNHFSNLDLLTKWLEKLCWIEIFLIARNSRNPCNLYVEIGKIKGTKRSNLLDLQNFLYLMMLFNVYSIDQNWYIRDSFWFSLFKLIQFLGSWKEFTFQPMISLGQFGLKNAEKN